MTTAMTMRAFRDELEKEAAFFKSPATRRLERAAAGGASEATKAKGGWISRKAHEAGAAFAAGAKSEVTSKDVQGVGSDIVEGMAARPGAVREVGGNVGQGMSEKGEAAFTKFIGKHGNTLKRNALIGGGALAAGVAAKKLYKSHRRRKEHAETISALRSSRALPAAERRQVLAKIQGEQS